MAAAPSAEEQASLDAMRTALDAKAKAVQDLEERTRKAEEEARAKGLALEEASRSNAHAEEAAQRLAEELKGTPGAQVLVEGPTVVVIVTDSFDSGSDRLKTNPDLRAALRAASMAIARHPEATVAIVGHTDSKPIQRSSWSDNTALSRARAQAVAQALSGDGVPLDRLKVDGVGPDDPLVAPEVSASDRAKNRRVEIEFAFAPKSS
jgi:flagellar motor protein MotB